LELDSGLADVFARCLRACRMTSTFIVKPEPLVIDWQGRELRVRHEAG
jgi:hypothetical protein